MTILTAVAPKSCIRPRRVFGLGILPTAPSFDLTSLDLGTTDPRQTAVLALLADRGYGTVRLAKVRLAMDLDQRTAASAPAIDKADKADVRAILNPPAVRRGPTAEDHAYELGRSLGLELEGPTDAPGHYSEGERFAFALGQDDASTEIARRVEAMAASWDEEQRWDDHCRRESIDVYA